METPLPGIPLAPPVRAASASGPPPALPDFRRHLPALDGLRGLAIAMVMVCHFLPYNDQPHSLSGRLFFFVGRCGWCGVDLFFVLSGFLITGILLEAKGASHYFRNFYARRTLRIFPLYYLVLTAVFVLIPLVRPDAFAPPELAAIRHRQAWLWTYGSNVLMSWKNDLGLFHADWLDLNPFWSLAVEHFYLVWPAVVFLCGRRSLKAVCLAIVGGSFVLRGVMFHKGLDDAIYVFTPCRVDTMALGALLAVLVRGDPRVARRLLGGAKGLAMVFGIAWMASLWHNPGRDRLWSVTAGYSLVAFFFAALLPAVLAAPIGAPLGRIFHSAWLRTLGKYSYGLYVYHVVLGSTFNRCFGVDRLKAVFQTRLHLGGAAYGAGVVAYLLLASAASFAVAWVSWNLLEKRFLTLKKYFEYRDIAR
jgi:peptidoglycan/LPS O-acetylase OafA/YrhL